MAAQHARTSAIAPMLASGAPARPPYLFVDLETTGLSGGAGTLAFLVGLARFDDEGGFVTRQHVLTAFDHERAMLDAVARDLDAAGAIVSFNGKSFDAPVLETRYLFHRLEWSGAKLPHIDVLHSSRLFWGLEARQLRRNTNTSVRCGSARQQPSGRECSLVALEGHVLGVVRAGDIPGFEIPSRYFRYVRSGDARPLADVLEHNRSDLLSLAGLTARLLELVADGPDRAADAGEALALGLVYARAGLGARANVSFERALSMCQTAPRMPVSPGALMERDRLDSTPTAWLRIIALRELARAARRGRRYQDAAERWRQILDVPGCPSQVRREASEALAIHHEHRAVDLSAAKAFALGSLDSEARPAWNDAIQYRLARIHRKMEQCPTPGLLAL